MELHETKDKLIKRINSSSDELLLIELLDMVEQYDVVQTLSAQQQTAIKERIELIEKGGVTYLDAKSEVNKIKESLNDL